VAALGTTLPTASSGRQKRSKKQQQQKGTEKRFKQRSLLDLDTSLDADTNDKRSTGRNEDDDVPVAAGGEENRRITRRGSVYYPVIL
jgi:hypothetical protein